MTTTSLTTLMKEIGEALKLDDDNCEKEAYKLYVSCMYKIATNLIIAIKLEGGDVVVDSKTLRQVKLMQQCADRMVDLLTKMEVTRPNTGLTTPTSPAVTPTTSHHVIKATNHSNKLQAGSRGSWSQATTSSATLTQPSTTANQFSASVPPLPPENNPYIYHSSKSRALTPMALAQKQNQSLMIAYKARMKRLNRSDFSAFNYSLTIQRKMAENIAIARAQEEELAKKMQARNQRLEEEAAKRFANPWGMSKEEQEHMHTYKKILEYENEAKWLQNWRKKMEANPEDPILVSQLVQEILRCSDHPFTELLHKYQFKIYERLYPLIANKHLDLEKIKVPYPREEWPSVEEVTEVCQETVKSPVTLSHGHESSNEKRKQQAGTTVSHSGRGDNAGTECGEEKEFGETCRENMPGYVGQDQTNVKLIQISDGSDETKSGSKGRIEVHQEWDDPLCVRSESQSCLKTLQVVENLDNNSNNSNSSNEQDMDSDKHSVHLTTDLDKVGGSSNNISDTAQGHAIDETQAYHNRPSSETPEKKSESKTNMPLGIDDTEANACSTQTIELAFPVANMAANIRDLTLPLDKGSELESQLSWGRRQAQILMRQVTEDYRNYDWGSTDMDEDNLDYLFDDDDDGSYDDVNKSERLACYSKTEDSSSNQVKSDPALTEAISPYNSGIKAQNVSYDRSHSHQPQANQMIGHDEDSHFLSLPANFNREGTSDEKQKFKKLSQEAYKRHLRSIADDIHRYLEKLLVMMTIAYEPLDNPVGKDQCAISLEEPFFKPIWKTLLRLFRVANYKQEIVLACVMTKYAKAPPEAMKVSKKFWLLDAGSQELPYQCAITQLKHVQDHYTMPSKLECVVKVCRLICQCVDDHYKRGDSEGQKTPSMGADDLLPILSYVVIQSGLPQLVSECQAMAEFIHEGYMMGEEGYCLTTLRTALSYITSLYSATLQF